MACACAGESSSKPWNSSRNTTTCVPNSDILHWREPETTKDAPCLLTYAWRSGGFVEQRNAWHMAIVGGSGFLREGVPGG